MTITARLAKLPEGFSKHAHIHLKVDNKWMAVAEFRRDGQVIYLLNDGKRIRDIAERYYMELIRHHYLTM